MSVTITAEHTGFVGYVVACCDGAAEQAPRFGSDDDAQAYLTRIPGGADYGCDDIRPVLPGCELPETCPEYPLRVIGLQGDQPPEVQLNNRNAALLFDALGLPEAAEPIEPGPLAEELLGPNPVAFDCGELTADDLLGRVLTAHALAPTDDGLPAVQDGRHTACGRRPGYLQERLAHLEHLAHWCRHRNLRITWG